MHPELPKPITIAEIASEKKGQDIVLMDMRKVSNVCDWFVIISAGSTRAIKALARAIDKGLSQKKVKSLRIEGRNDPFWVLLDYGDTVVHIFHKDMREFYGLERLWSDAPMECFESKC